MNANPENNIYGYRINIRKYSCFYFCPHFYEAFKKTCDIANAVGIDRCPSYEVLAYCKQCENNFI